MSNLSYSLEKKKNELIKQKKKIRGLINFLLIPVMISLILGIYIISSIDRFFYYIFPFFTTNSSVTSQIRSLDRIILYIFAVVAAITFVIYSSYKKLRDEHNNLRKSVIKNINTGLCNCNIPCNCKDDFVKEMEKEDIDLVFE